MFYSKIAWSNLGAIAYISHDQMSARICTLAWQPKKERWMLSGDLGLQDAPVSGSQMAHVSWSPSGVELAVIDVLGRVTIFSSLLAVNRYRQIYTSSAIDAGDDLAAVVGSHWLGTSHSVGRLHSECWYMSLRFGADIAHAKRLRHSPTRRVDILVDLFNRL